MFNNTNTWNKLKLLNYFITKVLYEIIKQNIKFEDVINFNYC